jgi:hypothetical protein
MTGDRIRSPPGSQIFLFASASRPALGSTPPTHSPRVKRPGRALTTYLHLLQRLRMRGAIPPLPQYFFMAWYLANHRDNIKRHDSSVCIALGYGLDDQGSRVRSQRGLGVFLFITASRPALGPTQPPIQWVPGVLFLGIKRPGCEADHSPQLPSTS